MKRAAAAKTAHTSPSKIGSGDYYGTAKRNPIGRMRDGFGLRDVSPKKLKNPPKSLA